jgi:hypothetical protein
MVNLARRKRLSCATALLRIDSMIDVREEQLLEARRHMHKVNIEKGIRAWQTKRDYVEHMNRDVAWSEITGLTYKKAKAFLDIQQLKKLQYASQCQSENG